MLPSIWKTLYSEGEARATASGDTLDIEIDCPIPHLYFELSTMAFVRRGLEMKAGRRVEMRRISGFDGGGHVVHYQFQLPTA